MSLNAAPQSIPTRRIQINHMNELPNDYGTTPGGTMFSTTPGGTRIIYDRKFLLKCRESPLSRTPPPNLPDIPGVTTPDKSPKRELEKVPEQKVTNMSPEEASYHAMPEFGWGPWPIYPQFLNFETGTFVSPPPLPNPPTSQLGLYRQRHLQQSPVSPIMPLPDFGNECIQSPFIPPQPMFKDHMTSPPPPPQFQKNNSMNESDSQLSIWRQTKAEKYFTVAEQIRSNSRSNNLLDDSLIYDQNSNCVVYADEDPSIIACCRSSLHEKDGNTNFTKLTSH